MPLRDLALIGLIVGSLPLCFLKPWIGILFWSWVGYMNPHRMALGPAYYMQFALMIGATTAAGFLFTKDRKPLPRTGEVQLLIALWVIFGLSTWLAAIHPDEAWAQLDKVSKILFATFLTIFLFQDRFRANLLIWVIALSIGFWGVKGGIFAILTKGQFMVLGPDASFIAGNTEIGLALNMILPFLFYLRRTVDRAWIRMGLLGAFGLTTIAVLGTYSRGALLGLGAVYATLLLRSRFKIIAAVALALIVPLILVSMPERWAERMGTISNYEEDTSAMQRIQSWGVASDIAADHPILGAGFRAFSEEVYLRYEPNKIGKGHDAHNIFLQVMAEHGYIGLVIYAGVMLAALGSARRIVRRTSGDPNLLWHNTVGLIIECSIAGYAVSGFFLSLSYFDLYFHLIALTAVTSVLLSEHEAAQAARIEVAADDTPNPHPVDATAS